MRHHVVAVILIGTLICWGASAPAPQVLAYGAAAALSPRGTAAARDEETDRNYTLGVRHYKRLDYPRAIKALEELRAGAPTPTQLEESLFLLGESYRAVEQPAKAAACYEELLRRYPRSDHRRASLAGRGECLVLVGSFPEAERVMADLLRDPGDEAPRGLYWLAEALAARDKPEPALERYRELLQDHPQHGLAPYAAHNSVLLLHSMNQHDRALTLLDKVVLDTAPPELRYQIDQLWGDVALAAGKPQVALAHYDRVQGEMRSKALSGVAWAAQRLGDGTRLQEAHGELRNNHANSPECAEVTVLLGAWHAEKGDIVQTDRTLATLGEQRSAEAHYWRGRARVVAKRPAEAIEHLQRATVEKGTWGANASFQLEYELRMLQRWPEALAVAVDFLDAYPQETRRPELLAGAVESCFQLRRDDAVMEFGRAFEKDHADSSLRPQVLRFVGESALRSDHLDVAVTVFQELFQKFEAQQNEVGPRLAWAIFLDDIRTAAPKLEPVLSRVTGASAAEVGTLLGRARLAVNNRSGAIAAFTAAQKVDPSGSAGRAAALELALLLVADESSRSQQAEPILRALASNAEGATRQRALVELGDLLHRRGDAAEARQFYESYLEQFPTGEFVAGTRLGLAFTLLQLEDHDAARAQIDELRREGAAVAVLNEATFLAGRIHQLQQRWAQAAQEYRRYLDPKEDAAELPRQSEVLLEWAFVEQSAGNLEAARTLLTRLVESHPKARERDLALYRRGWLGLEAAQLDHAQKSFETLLAEYPNSSYAGDSHFRLAQIAYDAEQYDIARGHYEAALDSADAERVGERSLFRIGWSYRRQEDWPQAQKTFVTLAQWPQGTLTADAVFLAADAAFHTGDTAVETQLLERFVKDHPTHEHFYEACVRLSELYSTVDSQWNRVRQLLEPLVEVELPLALKARHRVALGRALVRLGAAKSGLVILEEALAEGESIAAEAQFEMGLAHRALGDRGEAIEVFVNGYVLYPYRPWAVRCYLEAARDLLATGKKVEARRLLQGVKKDDPDGPWGKEAEKLLAEFNDKGSL